MVIAVCAFGIALHPETRTVRTGIGSAAPTPVRARAAEEFLNAALDEGGCWDNGKIIAHDDLGVLLEEHRQEGLEGLFLGLTGKRFRD